MQNIQRNNWYPVEYTVGLYRAVADLNEDVAARQAELFACGQHLAHQATNTFLRLLIKLLTPGVFARKFPSFWAKDHNFGKVDVDTSRFADNVLILNLSGVEGYDYIGPICAGWVLSAFQAMGIDGAKISETANPTKFDASVYRYELTWN